MLQLEAQALFDESAKRREVRVVGLVNEIKVFESSMNIIVTSEHVFHLKRPDNKETSEVKADTAKVVTEEDKALSALSAL